MTESEQEFGYFSRKDWDMNGEAVVYSTPFGNEITCTFIGTLEEAKMYEWDDVKYYGPVVEFIRRADKGDVPSSIHIDYSHLSELPINSPVSSPNGVLFGYYSAKADEMGFGTVVYATSDGREVVCTFTGTSSDDCGWDDIVCCGPVVKCIKKFKPSNTLVMGSIHTPILKSDS